MNRFKTLPGIALFLILLTSSVIAQVEYDSENPHTVKLLATKGENPGFIPIGEVRIWEDPDKLYIKYVITNADWRLSSTHVFVTSINQAFNPIGGYIEPFRLELEQAHMGEMEYTYQIPSQWPSGTQFCVAAKAEVLAIQGYSSDLEGLIDSLPDTVQVFAVQPSPDDLAYFQITIVESEILDGFHYGYCVDIDRPSIRRWYTAKVYTPYDELPRRIMRNPDNLDLVNWILNKDFVGKISHTGEAFTFGDVQHSIWELLEERTTNYTNGPWNILRANEIIESAKAEGEGYIPASNEKLLLILVPVNRNGRLHWQSMGIGIPTPSIPIFTTETAWGLAWNVSWYAIGPGLTLTIR